MAIRRDKDGNLVGARRKLEQAAALKHAQQFKQQRDEQEASPVPAVVAVLILSMAGAWVAADTIFKRGSIKILPSPEMNQTLFGPGLITMTNDPMMDGIISAVIRGVFIALLLGIVPLLTFVIKSLNNRAGTNVYVLNWGVIVGIFAVPMIIGAVWEYLSKAVY